MRPRFALILRRNATRLIMTATLFIAIDGAAEISVPPIHQPALSKSEIPATLPQTPSRQEQRLASRAPYQTLRTFKRAANENRIDDALDCLSLKDETARLRTVGFPPDAIQSALEMRMRFLASELKNSRLQINKRADGRWIVVFDPVETDGAVDSSLRQYQTQDGKFLIFSLGDDGRWRISERTVMELTQMPDTSVTLTAARTPILSDTPAAAFETLLQLGARREYERIADRLLEPASRDSLPDIFDSEALLSVDRIRVKRALTLYHYLRDEKLSSSPSADELNQLQRVRLETTSGKTIIFVRNARDEDDNENASAEWRFSLETVSVSTMRDWAKMRTEMSASQDPAATDERVTDEQKSPMRGN